MNMKLILVFSLAFIAVLAFSEDRYSISNNNVWNLVKLGDNGGPSEFTGTVETTGTYTITWEYHPEFPSYQIFFKPKSGLEELIPIFTDSPIPKIVTFANKNDTFELLVKDKSLLEKLKTGELPPITGVATIVFKNLSSAVDCNYRSYIVDIVTAKNLVPTLNNKSSGIKYGC
jgi:hypothetical protein